MAVSFRSSSIRSVSDDNSGTVAIPVPSGASAGDIVVAYVGTWNSLSVVNPPSGFTFIAVIDSGGGSPTRVLAYWKRLTSSDAGTYDFTNALEWANGGAICFVGGLASGDPLVDFDTGTAFSDTFPNLAVDADEGSGLAWVSYNESTDTSEDPPDGYTGIQTQDYGMAAWNVAATTGTHTATGATADATMQLAAILVAIAPEPDAGGDIIEAAPVGMALTPQAATTQAGAVTLDAQPVGLTLESQPAATVAGPVDVAAQSVGLTLTPQAATTVPGGVTIQAQPVELTLAPQAGSTMDTMNGEPVGMIVGTVTGPSRKVETVTGPAVRRVVTGPAVSRKVTGPSLAAFAVDGPSRHVATLDGPDLSRLITGPDVARTLTGPGV